MRVVLLLVAAAFLCASAVRADELTRQVQEELRKRALFYGDVDGRSSRSLAAALRQYQERKGFAATGEIDADTVRSMGISAAGNAEQLPNVPVLRSDRGRAEGSNQGDLSAVALPGAINASIPSREELRSMIRGYLDACETPAVTDELNYYAARVEYFDHGLVTRSYIKNELVSYNQQWPERRYQIGNTITTSKRGFYTVAKCRISFELANPEQDRRAAGQTDNTFVLARGQDSGWEMVSHREERVRRKTTRCRARESDPVSETMRRVQRSVRKLFR